MCNRPGTELGTFLEGYIYLNLASSTCRNKNQYLVIALYFRGFVCGLFFQQIQLEK